MRHVLGKMRTRRSRRVGVSVRRRGQFQRKGRKPCREMAEKRSFTEPLEVGTEYAATSEDSGGQTLPWHGGPCQDCKDWRGLA